MQKTTFPFELIIGEDCSTDGTREIVMDYAQKYPEIIRVITSESNVGMMENTKRTGRACRGEFIAYCEGDDYWIDPLKLQKQYEAIIKQDAVLVTHSNIAIYYQDGKIAIESKVKKALDESGFLDIKNIILHLTTFHTSSIFIRAEIIRNLPDWLYQAPVGDYPLKIIAAYLGKVYYINEIMSVYQKRTPGSYTDRKRTSKIRDGSLDDPEKDFLRMYANLDSFTGYQFSDLIHECITLRLISYYNKRGHLDYLEINEIQKKILRWIAFLTRPFPNQWRLKILGKIVESVQKGGSVPFIGNSKHNAPEIKDNNEKG